MTLNVFESHLPYHKPFQIGFFLYIYVALRGPSASAELLVITWITVEIVG